MLANQLYLEMWPFYILNLVISYLILLALFLLLFCYIKRQLFTILLCYHYFRVLDDFYICEIFTQFKK